MTPPLVFTHGWKDSADAWSAVVDELGKLDQRSGFDDSLVTWNLPYHGGAAALEQPERPARAELLTLLDAHVDRAGTPAVLVGHSLGGYLSLAYTLEHPDKVAGLVLIATGPGFKKAEPREAWNKWARKKADPTTPGQELVVLQHDAAVIEGLGNIVAPTLVIQGARDTQYDGARKVFTSRIAGSEAVVLEGGGHNVHRKMPETVASLIADFMKRRV